MKAKLSTYIEEPRFIEAADILKIEESSNLIIEGLLITLKNGDTIDHIASVEFIET